jgi:hypothetical protein
MLHPADVLALASEIDYDEKLLGVRALECVCGLSFQTDRDFFDHLDRMGVVPPEYDQYFARAQKIRRANAEQLQAIENARESARL